MQTTFSNTLILIFLFLFSMSFNSAAQLNPFNIGTLRPADSIVIYYDVTINNPCNCTEVSNQGTVSGSNFASFNTDDPDTGPGADPTITLLNMWPLPVSLTEIRGVKKGNGIEVSWKVSSEINIIKYEVERSMDGRNFSKIGEVQSVNSTAMFWYSFPDQQPGIGSNFYRLRIIDATAATKFSPVVRIDLSAVKEEIRIYPNPVTKKQLTIQLLNGEKGRYTLLLINSAGQTVYKTEIVHAGGSAVKTLSLPIAVPAGIYKLELTSEGTRSGATLIVQ